jgi:hypothetical protein
MASTALFTRRSAAVVSFSALSIAAGCSSSPPGGARGEPLEQTSAASSSSCGASGANAISYHNGAVLSSPIHVYYIFYGAWTVPQQNIAIGFANNIDTTSWWPILQTYCDGQGNPVTLQVSYAGSVSDNLSQGTTPADPAKIVTDAIDLRGLPSDPTNGLYIVMGSKGVSSAAPPGAVGFHSTIPSRNLTYAFINNSCVNHGGDGTSGFDCEFITLAHELAEAASDPASGGWYDGAGQEIGDLCNANPGAAYPMADGSSANLHMAGYDYLVQSVWVNSGGGYCAMSRSSNDGKPCSTGADCGPPGICTAGVCVVPTCSDGIIDGDESDVDCGGSCGAGCGVGKRCQSSADCTVARNGRHFALGNLCLYGVCGWTCLDGVQDGDETDVDCGGSCSVKCAAGQGCVSNSDCPRNHACSGGVCSTGTCSNAVHDNQETAVDCGGPNCAPCANQHTCARNSDCQSGDCYGANELCVALTCSDMVKDGSESDVDCGGPDCVGCSSGQACVTWRDCFGHAPCNGGVCAAPSCSDGKKDGTETGIDCGGSCPGCGTGLACNTNADCQSHYCIPGAVGCVAATCADGVLDGSETDIDCGGGSCPACPNLKKCQSTADCQSGLCSSGECLASGCTDGIKNGNETDIDCGGGVCAPCEVGSGCTTTADCDGEACVGGVCARPLCSDRVRDGLETDVDCGGGSCPPCATLQACARGQDCQTGVCSGGTCVIATCADGVQDGTESDTDCGGGTCGPCSAGKHCSTWRDCFGHAPCSAGVCAQPSCTDAVKDGNESAVDCGGSCPGCSNGYACNTNADCRSHYCLSGAIGCAAASCTDGIRDGYETDIDCGGSANGSGCPACGGGAYCIAPSDCQSGTCTASTCAP